jgi:hypothetical protein
MKEKGMASGNQKGHEGGLRLFVLEGRRKEVSFHVVNWNERSADGG